MGGPGSGRKKGSGNNSNWKNRRSEYMKVKIKAKTKQPKTGIMNRGLTKDSAYHKTLQKGGK